MQWEGYVVRVILSDDDTAFQSHHAATILVKMNESDQEGVNGADLGLSISEQSLAMLQDNLNELHTGDHILF